MTADMKFKFNMNLHIQNCYESERIRAITKTKAQRTKKLRQTFICCFKTKIELFSLRKRENDKKK